MPPNDIKHEDVLNANKEYYNIVAEEYLQNEAYAYSPDIVRSVRSNIENVVRQLNGTGEEKRFLDIGCGSGFLTGLVQELAGGYQIYGIDISERQVDLYTRKFPKARGMVGDIARLPFQDGFFDFVACYSVLHHVFDYGPVIEQISRVTKSNGYFYCDFEPNRRFKEMAGGLIRLRRKHFDKAPQGMNTLEAVAEYHNNYQPGIDNKNISDQLEKFGFEVVEVGRRFPDSFAGGVLKVLSVLGWSFVPCFYIIARKR